MNSAPVRARRFGVLTLFWPARARSWPVLALACPALALLPVTLAGQQADTSGQRLPGVARDTAVACTASSVTATPGERVRIRVAVDPTPVRARYRWSASGGVLADSGATAVWRPGGAATGIYTIEAEVSRGTTPLGRCAARVLVVPPREQSRGSGDRVLRAALARGAREEPGWGRYNYLLAGSRPADSAQVARFRAVVARFLARLDDIEDYVAAAEQSLAPGDSAWRRNFSLTLIPVRKPLGRSADSASAILAGYDYARAKLLLASLPGTHADGPYLVSAARPLSDGPARDYVLVDLSHISPGLAGQWTNYFVQQAAVEYPRAGFDPRRALLVMRTAMAQLGTGTSEIARGLATWRKLYEDAVSWSK